MDGGHVQTELTAFVLRIAAMIALIVGVITTGTMVVLYRTALGPILRLRRSMLLAAAEPDRADVFQVTERPRDELGEVFQTHNLMLTRIAESKRADRLHAEEQTEFLSQHDLLTLLPNRAFLVKHLREALPAARTSGEAVAVLILNLAGFRNLNEGYGQHTGNQVLRIVARRLSQRAPGDFIARIGGDDSAGAGGTVPVLRARDGRGVPAAARSRTRPAAGGGGAGIPAFLPAQGQA